jgi:hypothetical protein
MAADAVQPVVAWHEKSLKVAEASYCGNRLSVHPGIKQLPSSMIAADMKLIALWSLHPIGGGAVGTGGGSWGGNIGGRGGRGGGGDG